MSKIVLPSVETGFNTSQINANFNKIEEALNDNVLYRDVPLGEPNAMQNNLDMNNNRIYNLPQPINANEPVRLVDLQEAAVGGVVLTAGNVGVEDAGNYFTGTNVETVLQEIGTSLAGTGSILPDQSGQSGKYLKTVTNVAQWDSITPDEVGVKRNRFLGLGQGASNQYTAFMAAYNAVPDGGTLYIDGIVAIGTAISLTRRVSIICQGADDGFWMNVGTGNDALTFSGGASGIQEVKLKINVYGPVSSCKNAVVLSRVDRSDIYVNVRTGAVQYGLVLDGCLINNIRYECSTNYNPPVTGYGTPVDGLLSQKNVANNIASNINNMWVNIEGVRHGFVQSAQPNEGGNILKGVIEGLTGRSLTIADCQGFHITDFWDEANTSDPTFLNCVKLYIGPGVEVLGTPNYQFSFCKNTKIDGFYGGYNIGVSCVGTQLGQIGSPDGIARSICADITAEQIGYMHDASYPVYQVNPQGISPMETIFVNPFVDIYDSVAPNVGPPVGFSTEFAYISGTLVRDTSIVYPGAGNIYSMLGTSSGTSITNGCIITPGMQPPGEDVWVSVMIPIYCLSNNGRAEVYIDDGNTYQLIGKVTTTGQWVVVRGSAKIRAGVNWRIRIAIGNLSGTYGNGYNYRVGGVNVVKGARPPKYLANSHARMHYIGTSITNTPFRQGALAMTGGNIYMAVSNGLPTDWLKLSP